MAKDKTRPPEMSRFIIFSVLFFITIFFTGSLAFIFSMRQIIRLNKGNELSQLLEIERVKLETSVNNEVVIALKMASSPLIERYFANPHDPELRAMAVEEIISYQKAFASEIIFWINDIDKLFYYNDVEPYLMNPENPENYWYNMTLYETEVYNFNINYNPDLHVTRLWINAPVFDPDGKPIGMLGTGIDITTYLELINENLIGRASIYLFNAYGEITGAKDPVMVEEKKNIEEEIDIGGDGIIAMAKKNAPYETQILDTPFGRIALGTVPLLEWYSVAVMPDSLDDYKNTMTVLFIVVLAVIVVIFIIFNFFIAGLLKPLRRSMIEAQEANYAKSAFLATMSHEIRTPMNSIMGFAELATDSDFVPQIKDYLGKIADSTKWLLHIINDILDISKIEAGKMELDNTPFNLNDVFFRCQSAVLPMVKEKGLELSVYAEPSIGKKLIGDPVRLFQALMNLLSNAVKFTDKGTVKFSSAIRSADNDKTTIYFEVKDTGIGMTSEQLGKVFDMFVQADSSTTRDYGGTGLGLAIAKNIIGLMGGKLLAESTPDEGSSFSFELTFNTVDATDEATEQAKFEMLERPYFEGLILVCDDNTLNQKVICAHLERLGLNTIAVENGKIAVDTVRERKERGDVPFNLIFMDMFMPVMDGMEAASKIMAMDTGTPIVVMTANIMVSELEKYKRQGMSDCLGKPFTSQELWRILLKYMTPLGSKPLSGPIDEDEQEENEELQKKLRINFLKGNLIGNNQTVHTQIMEAVASGDTKLAHRLAHTLKGNAGLIGKTGLRNAAAEVEALLRDGSTSIWENKMNNLKTELMTVLEELKPLLDEPVVREKSEMLSLEQTMALFAKLQPMLENNNTDCFDLLDELHIVPGAEELAQQINDFDFKSATGTLVELKKKWEEAHE